MEKWNFNLASMIDNYRIVMENHKENKEVKLLGIIFGVKKERLITNIIFYNSESEELKEKAAEILEYLSPEIEALGVAKLSDVELSDAADFELFKEQITLKFSSLDLKKYDLKKLSSSNPHLIVDEMEIRKVNSIENSEKIFLQFELDFESALFLSKIINENIEFVNEETDTLLKNDTLTSSTVQQIWDKLKNATNSSRKICFKLRTKSIENLLSEIKIDSKYRFIKDFTANVLLYTFRSINNCKVFSLIQLQLQRFFLQCQRIHNCNENISNFSTDIFLHPNNDGILNRVFSPTWDLEEKEKRRVNFNKLLNLPHFLPNNSLLQHSLEPLRILINPHNFIKYIPKGRIEKIRGMYQYYHYMQDEINDAGWGCAYRSFQTIWSWFLLQRITDKPVPTHIEIQQCLVDIKDKPTKFVGSRQWIGSVELGFCLTTLLGDELVETKIIPCNSGANLSEHARLILYHFENFGAPIMIGGNQLAHTILGLDYNVRSGECQYLVLDPHYIGGENVDEILKKGWCGWKPASFWDKKARYNLLLPSIKH